MEQKPSIGRVVHYQRYGSPGGEHKAEPSPAIITQIHPDGDCQLFVMNPNGVYFNKTPYSQEPKPGHWSWPPRGKPDYSNIPLLDDDDGSEFRLKLGFGFGLVPVDEVMAFFAERKATLDKKAWHTAQVKQLSQMFYSLNTYLGTGAIISDSEGNLREPSQVEPRV